MPLDRFALARSRRGKPLRCKGALARPAETHPSIVLPPRSNDLHAVEAMPTRHARQARCAIAMIDARFPLSIFAPALDFAPVRPAWRVRSRSCVDASGRSRGKQRIAKTLHRLGSKLIRDNGCRRSGLMRSARVSVLVSIIRSGKLRSSQLSKGKDLDRKNRLPANFPTWRDMIASSIEERG